MELWIARDKDGLLHLYLEKPTKEGKYGWFNPSFDKESLRWGSWYELPTSIFPEVTWENSPQKVTIELADVVHGHLGTELSQCECVQINAPANPIMNRGLHEFDLSVRAMHCLESADIHTVGELVKWNRSDLLKLRNFGLHTLREIEDFLTDHDLTFGMKVKEA